MAKHETERNEVLIGRRSLRQRLAKSIAKECRSRLCRFWARLRRWAGNNLKPLDCPDRSRAEIRAAHLLHRSHETAAASDSTQLGQAIARQSRRRHGARGAWSARNVAQTTLGTLAFNARIGVCWIMRLPQVVDHLSFACDCIVVALRALRSDWSLPWCPLRMRHLQRSTGRSEARGRANIRPLTLSVSSRQHVVHELALRGDDAVCLVSCKCS